MISQEYIEDWFAKHKDSLEENQLSFFEIMTALAFHYFKDCGCNWAVIEAGLGGRLDATNVLQPDTVIITSISKDHQNILGDSIEEITKEKAAVIKKDCKLFVGLQDQTVIYDIIERTAINQKVFPQRIDQNIEVENVWHDEKYTCFDFRTFNHDFKDLRIQLIGEWQIENASLALFAFLHTNLNLERQKIYHALKSTQWQGRMERISDQPRIFADVAHNEAGLSKVLKFIKNKYSQLESSPHLICSFLKRKNWQELLKIIEESRLPATFIPIEYYEGVSYQELKQIINDPAKNWSIENEFQFNSLDRNKIYFLVGSHFLLSEVVPKIKSEIQ